MITRHSPAFFFS